MISKSARTRRGTWLRNRLGDRGAAMVEAAIITPVLILLVVGMIEMGFAIKNKLALASSARAGARVASAEPRMDTFVDDTVRTVQKGMASVVTGVGDTRLAIFEASNGREPTGPGCAGLANQCVEYRWNPATKTFTFDSGTWNASSVNACPGDAGKDAVGVRLDLDHNYLTRIIGSGMHLSDTAVLDFEPVPPLNVCK